ncbi:MAG: hypothetical protein AAGC81_10120 [Pseudomonadota bacterium]
MKKLIAIGAMALMLAPGIGHATSASPTLLTEGGTVIETLTTTTEDLANDANWFVFDATAGDSLDIDINRRQAAGDLVASLFIGDVTGTDFGSAIVDFIVVAFGGTQISATADEILPLVFLISEDDTEDDAFGGNFEDPRFTQIAPVTGRYSVVVSSFDDATGTGQFDITVSGTTTVVPIPAVMPLMLTALGFFGLFYRRCGQTVT